MMTTTTLSSLRLPAKPRSNNNYIDYDDDDNNKDVMIASTSKNNDNHNVIFFAPVAVAIATADEGVIRPFRCLLTLTPLHRRRGRDPLLLELQSTYNNKDNETLIACTSKNNKDHLQSLSGLQTTVELTA
jgi:hypothetical protein